MIELDFLKKLYGLGNSLRKNKIIQGLNNITIDQIEIFVSLCLKLKKIEYRYNYNKNTIPKIVSRIQFLEAM